MSSKPRKAFDGVARPQGFIDDAAKAAVNAVRKAVGKPYYMYLKDETTGKAAKEFGRIKVSSGKTIKKPNLRGTQFPKNQSLSPRKFDKFYGKGASKAVAEQTKRNAKKYAK